MDEQHHGRRRVPGGPRQVGHHGQPVARGDLAQLGAGDRPDPGDPQVDPLDLLARVVAVDRGTAAIPLLERESFDLLLTDIVMPEMDGIELAQRAGELCRDLRVMFITGFAAVTLKAGKAMPQARVLSKPFHLRDLVLEVDRMFERSDASGL